MSADELAGVMRVLLASITMCAPLVVRRAWVRSHDANPIPWTFFGVTLALYSLGVWTLILSTRPDVVDWWRSVFSTLNIMIVVGSLWVIKRAVWNAR